MKIDLSNDGGKTVYRVWMYKGYESLDEDEHRYNGVETMVIFIKKYLDNGNGNLAFWMNRGELIFEKKFYSINLNYRSINVVYCEEKDDCESIKCITRERYKNNSENQYITLSEKYNKIAIRCVKKIKGWKSAQLKDVKMVQRRIGYGYEIVFNNGKRCVIYVK